ncbi:MAG: DUF1232 domain-containing protein [Bryobacteraceae bacterium]
MKTAVIVIVTAFLLVALYQGAGLALRAWRSRMNIRAVIAAVMTAAYAVSPIDIVPDVLFGIGWIDDLIVIAMAFLYIRRLLQQDGAAKAPAQAHHARSGHGSSAASRATIEVVPDAK